MSFLDDENFALQDWSEDFYQFESPILYLAEIGEYKKFGITKNFHDRIASYRTHNPIDPTFHIFYSKNIRSIETYLNREMVQAKTNYLSSLNKEWSDYSYDKIIEILNKAINTDVKWKNRFRSPNYEYKNNLWRFKYHSDHYADEFKSIPTFKEKFFYNHVLFDFRYANFRIITSNSDIYEPNSKNFIPAGERLSERCKALDQNDVFRVEFYIVDTKSQHEFDIREHEVIDAVNEINNNEVVLVKNIKPKETDWKLRPTSKRYFKYRGVTFELKRNNETDYERKFEKFTLPFDFLNEFFLSYTDSKEKYEREIEHFIEE